MLKIRRPLGRLIFNMGIAIPGKTVFLIETAPRYPGMLWSLWNSFENWILVYEIYRCPKFKWVTMDWLEVLYLISTGRWCSRSFYHDFATKLREELHTLCPLGSVYISGWVLMMLDQSDHFRENLLYQLTAREKNKYSWWGPVSESSFFEVARHCNSLAPIITITNFVTLLHNALPDRNAL